MKRIRIKDECVKKRRHFHQPLSLDEPNKHQLLMKPDRPKRIIIKTLGLEIKAKISAGRMLFFQRSVKITTSALRI